MLTMKARYAIRVLTALASCPKDQPVLVGELAKSEDIPHRFLEGIMLELRQRGILQSRRGRGGGYHLLMAAEKITIDAVVTALDGPISCEPCATSLSNRSCKICHGFSTCGTRRVLERVHSAVLTTLQDMTIAELARFSQEPVVEPTSPSASAPANPPRLGSSHPVH